MTHTIYVPFDTQEYSWEMSRTPTGELHDYIENAPLYKSGVQIGYIVSVLDRVMNYKIVYSERSLLECFEIDDLLSFGGIDQSPRQKIRFDTKSHICNSGHNLTPFCNGRSYLPIGGGSGIDLRYLSNQEVEEWIANSLYPMCKKCVKVFRNKTKKRKIS